MPYPELKAGYGFLADDYIRSICQIECHFGEAANAPKRIGTGFLIARTTSAAFVVTAGHMLFHHGRRRTATRIEVAFECSGTFAFRRYTLDSDMEDRCTVPQEFLSNGDAAGEFDYGLFRIDEALADMTLIPLSSVVPRSSRAKLVGYPEDHSDGTEPYHAIFEIDEAGSENYDYLDQKTYTGMSGGPLLSKTKGDETIKAFGLHIRGDTDHRAVRFSSAVRANLRRWSR